MFKQCVISCTIILIMSVSHLSADDWPNYLGSHQNNISKETGLLASWSEKEPEVLWSHSVGKGFGGAAIRENKVYILDRIDSKQDVMRCFDLNSGDELWQYAHEDPGEFGFNGSRSFPAVDEDHVYAIGPMGTVYCIDLDTHKPVWMHNFIDEYDAELPEWGFGLSPLLYGNLVIVAPQLKKAGVVAYDKETGKIVWETGRLCHAAGYSSPTMVNLCGSDQIVVITQYLTQEMRGEDEDEENEEDEEEKEEGEEYDEEEEENIFDEGGVYGLDVNTGDILWNFRDFYCGIPIPPVTSVGDNRVFVTGGYESSATLLKIDKKGNQYNVEMLFRKDDVKSQIHPALFYKDHLFIQGNGANLKDGLMCMTLDGDILWKTGRKPGFDWGGFLLADEHVFIMDGKRGDLYLIQPDLEKYIEVSKKRVLKRPQVWAPLALSNGRLVVRDQHQIKCIRVQ